MSKFVFTLFFMAVAIPFFLYAQAADTVYVPNDNNAGTINNVIQGDTLANGSRTNPNRVYMLYRGGYYQLNATLTTNPGTHITIIGEPANKPNTGADSGMAVVVEAAGWPGTLSQFMDSYGDLTIKNVWMIYADPSGTNNWWVIQFEQNSNPQAFGDFDNCIFDYVRGVAVMANRTDFVGTFNNCIFRNCIDPGQWWAGRMIATNGSSSTMDSVGAENCTFENMGFAYQTDYIPPARVWFNHNTFLNIVKFAFKFYYMTHLVCTNNIFVNCHFSGERFSDRSGQDPDNLLYGAVLDVDTLPTDVNYNNVSELQRVVLFNNNSNYTSPVFQTWYNTYNDTAATLKGKIQPEPMMNDRTLDMFNWHPYMKMKNVYNSDGIGEAYNPRFAIEATNLDSIYSFLQAKYVTGGNVFWGYNPDPSGTWPLKENLAYSNDTLLHAGISGYPLGDLYHWFPAKYATWLPQRASEDHYIYQTITSVKQVSNSIPKIFVLNQNYPNPFNPATQIEYSIPQNGFVTLKVYNVLGQEVSTLFSGMQTPGSYKATFDGSNLASGVYLYRLEAGKFSVTKKMILMK
jgi:hypothetical protein